MNLSSFSILTALALIYAGLTLSETALYRTWDDAQREQRNIQYKTTYFQRMNGFIEQLVRRVAIDSQHDPALTELLKRHRIQVVVSSPDAAPSPDGAGAAAAGSGVMPAPAPADKVVPASQPPASSHP